MEPDPNPKLRCLACGHRITSGPALDAAIALSLNSGPRSAYATDRRTVIAIWVAPPPPTIAKHFNEGTHPLRCPGCGASRRWTDD
jgi:DNA-directed RNA polymerase subunit RPC12/RpoP